MIKRIFIVGLLIVAAYLAYKQFAVRDYSSDAVAVANSVNEILLALGATDADIAGQYRRQMSNGNARWIEFNKRARVSFDEKAAAALDDMAARLGCDVVKSKTSEGDEIRVKSSDRIYYYLIFLKKPAARRANRVAIVIDDLGYNLKDVEEFLALGAPMTYAVLPREHNSRSTAELLSGRGAAYMVHFPLEPDDPLVNPGRAAALTSMGDKEIAGRFAAAIKTVPGAFGVSNHMGSKFTRTKDKMRTFLSLVQENGLIYFDSRTTEKSVASSVAAELGMRVFVNQIFLDNDGSREAIDKQLALVLKKSKKQPLTFAIGHVHKKNLPRAIKDFIPRFEEAGVEFVSLKELYGDTGPIKR
ncbi:MAG: divergent polysaccharide deacetylase family protein [Endomicrobiia bacterium]|nr:divergent polysaccharide deacetylase family protein [Endomicrobiia bacterium]